MADWASINGVAAANVAKILGVAKSSISKCGALNTPSAASGYSTKSYSLDGSDEWIQIDGIATSNNFDWQADAQSISVWFKTSTAAPGALWCFGHNSQSQSYYMLTVQGTTTVEGTEFNPRVYLLGKSNTAGLFGKNDATSSPNGNTGFINVNQDDTGGINPADGNWHNIIATFSGSASTVKAVNLYIDGTYVGFSKSRSSNLNVDDFAIGVNSRDNHDEQSQFFNGHIAQLSLYTSSVTPTQARAIYNSGAPINEALAEPHPIHFYRFGDGDSDGPGTLTDYGTGGVDGTGNNLESGDIVDESP
jgi:hypothetical protein|tara:strand:- start:1917 stop:2831 length:915 start_codon:yes stop_codon:yes gene_type:complete